MCLAVVPEYSAYPTTLDISPVRGSCVILHTTLGGRHLTRELRKLLLDHRDLGRLCRVRLTAAFSAALQRFDPYILSLATQFEQSVAVGCPRFPCWGFLCDQQVWCVFVGVLLFPFPLYLPSATPVSETSCFFHFAARESRTDAAQLCRRGPSPVWRPHHYTIFPLYRSFCDRHPAPLLGFPSGNLLLARWCLVNHNLRSREYYGTGYRERIRPG